MAAGTQFAYFLYIFVLLIGLGTISSARNNTTRKITPSHYKFKTNTVAPVSRTPTKITGKWQVGRVSRKQYEIINMLYRKTKIFIETENTSTVNTVRMSKHRSRSKNNQHVITSQKLKQESFQAVHPRPNDRPLTPSYIEFYYLDESDERVKRKGSMPKNYRTGLQSGDYKLAFLRPPFFLFRVNDATCKPTTLNYKTFAFHNIKLKDYTSQKIKDSVPVQKRKLTQSKHFQHKFTTRTVNKIDNMKSKTDVTENKRISSLIKEHFTTLVPKTSYDRIKFFEIYDSDTYKPRMLVDNKMNIIYKNNIQSEEKISLDQVDHGTDSNESTNITRYVKKNANHSFKENEVLNSQINKITNKTSATVKAKRFLTKLSQPAAWSDFPFIAVYVYEPMQVRCDSAAISPHWLVATAACLYRHHRNLNSNTEGRSAFVTYCGGSWRLPGRIAYVKRSFVHPRYQSKHKSRRYLYNIGVIEVVNSMANTCSGWRPVSLMSHQFVTDRGGSYATAVGWGLDRYDKWYTSADLPTYPLMLYESLVYSDSCPGNDDYSKVKVLNGESVKNVYCLSLPTYTLEEKDTVHGGILLIGGKLIALYLQETIAGRAFHALAVRIRNVDENSFKYQPHKDAIAVVEWWRSLSLQAAFAWKYLGEKPTIPHTHTSIAKNPVNSLKDLSEQTAKAT